MHLRYRIVLPFVALCLAFAAAPALAGKPQPIQLGSPSTEPHEVQMGTILSPEAACALGVLPPPALAFGYIIPPADAYYQLINPAQCASCNGGPLVLTTAHILLYFTSACQIPVTVSIKPATFNAATGCYAPNPLAPPLCEPATYLLNNAGFLNQCVDYQLPMAPGCCISGPVFLEFTFNQGTCPNSRPAFCGPASCTNCTQYNYYPGATFPGDDLCATLSPQGIFGINMWADADCCGATPTTPGSWGKVKTLYR